VSSCSGAIVSRQQPRSGDGTLPVAERIRPDEQLDFARAVGAHFFEDESEERQQRWVDRIVSSDQYSAWVVRDGAQIVGNLGVHLVDLSVPGGARIGNAAVTAVGVAQTHRRRGILRTLMTACLDEAAERGDPVATLYASEAAIYGRFGFGVCTQTLRFRIDRGVTFRDPVDPTLVRPLPVDEALEAVRPVFEGLRDQRASVGFGGQGRWELSFVDDPPDARDGMSARRLVHVPGRGYATYRIKGDWDDFTPKGTVHVRDLVATDPEAEAALWQHVCDVDLTTRVEAWLRAVDDPLPQLLVDQARTRPSFDPPVYSRLLDVPAALQARTYGLEARTVFRVHDATRDQTGTFRLEVGPDGASCQKAGDREPELELDIETLSSVWLGGVRTTQLLDARRVVEHRPGAAAAFDRLLATDRAPWTPFMF
jgi:predicted acetyltransferase